MNHNFEIGNGRVLTIELYMIIICFDLHTVDSLIFEALYFVSFVRLLRVAKINVAKYNA